MKSLVESLFDKDLAQKGVPGFQLKDIVFFDGQWVYKYQHPNLKKNNVLEIIDWKKVRADLKKWGGDKIDLGRYAYANADAWIIRNSETVRKTENFARLIMSIPYAEECYFGSFNSRFRDEFLLKLNKYILPEYGPDYPGFHFDIVTTRFGLVITIEYDPTGDEKYLRFEFLKKSDDE